MAIFVSFTALGWKCFVWCEDRYSCSLLVSIYLIFIFKLCTFSLYMSSKFKFWLTNLIYLIHANVFLPFCYYLLVFYIVFLSNFLFVWGVGYFSEMLKFNSLYILWVHSSKLCLFLWWLLSLIWFEYRIPLTISCRFGLIVMTSLSVFLSRKSFIFFISEGSIAGYDLGQKVHYYSISNSQPILSWFVRFLLRNLRSQMSISCATMFLP